VALRTRPSVVLLDLGETLVRPEPSWWAVYASSFETYGIEASHEDFERAFRAAWREWAREGPFEATEEASFERLMTLDRLVFDRLGYPALPISFFRDVERAFARRSAWFVYPDVVPALDALRAAGLRLGVVSNWGWAAPELLHLLELARHFEAFAISSRVGYQKPHPAIFRHALDLLEAGPEEAIHVGDDPETDVAGARRAGIEAVLVTRREEAPVGTGAAAVVRDLAELVDLLGIGRSVARAGA
jgi:putative hydrolase of the HAD superfamily